MSKAPFNSFEQRLLQLVLLGLIFLNLPALAYASDSTASCYSAYKLTQKIEYSVNFALDLQQNTETVELLIHTREVALTEKERSRLAILNNTSGIRAHLILVSPTTTSSKPTTGPDALPETPYTHLFLAYSDSASGHLIQANSNTNSSAQATEHASFYDLFQYSKKTGIYRYKDGNGFFSAKIEVQPNNETTTISKKNMSYLPDANGNDVAIDLIDSQINITTSANAGACFYQKAIGTSTIESILSTTSMFTATTGFKVELSPAHRLENSHFFHSLTTDISTWPNVEPDNTLSLEDAQQRLPFLMTQLNGLIANDDAFLRTIQSNENLLPHLADFIIDLNLSNDLSRQLYWALGRINSKTSVSALAELSTRALNPVDKFRAVMALSTSNAPLNTSTIESVIAHVQTLSGYESISEEDLVLVRMLGALADMRSSTDPITTAILKEFLYSQVNSPSEPISTATLSAIGNLRNSIDEQGREILFEHLDSESDYVRQTSASALSRVPYRSEETAKVIKYIEKEPNIEVQQSLVETLGNALPTDSLAKEKLIALATTKELSASVTNSLSKADFSLNESDIKKIGVALSVEKSTQNKKKLVSLILRNRKTAK